MKYFRIFNNVNAYREYMMGENKVVPNISYCYETNESIITPSLIPPTPTIDMPIIACDGEDVTITCTTVGADIYYRLNESGTYSAYTTPITITADTVVEAYAELNGDTSNTAKQTCEVTDFSKKYFTIESLEDSNTISLRVHSGATGNIAYYSTDNGNIWTQIALGSGTQTITITTLNSGDTVLIKATSKTSGQQAKWAKAYNGNSYFNTTKTYKVYGNVMSLLVGDDFATATTITQEFALCGLFFGGNNASKLLSAKNLVLPATGLTTSSYNGMFRNCSAMTESVKVLPATTLYKDCYSSMFENCRSLSEPPEIMATTVNSSIDAASMKAMFAMNRNSAAVTTSMTKGPILRVTNPSLAQNTYESLFDSNASLTEVTILAQGTDLSFKNWLRNATSGGKIKKLSSTTLVSGVNGIPSGWSTQDID